MVTHRVLLQSNWDPDYGDEADYLRIYINGLRQKVEGKAGSPKLLVTEPGVGYRFVGILT